MLFYFTGTGNSRYAAKRIAQVTGDSMYAVNDAIKAGESVSVEGEKRLIFVFPTYAWRIPKVLEAWIRQSTFAPGVKAWFVMTCGSGIGDAGQYNRLLCREKRLQYMGTAKIVMPENYIAMFKAPGEEKAKQIIAAADPVIKTAADLIGQGRAFSEKRRKFPDRLLSSLINAWFGSFSVSAKAFYAKDNCIGCGKCAKLCPLNNITLENGRPVWGESCTHCMACICRCPTEAIEYGKKSLGKVRYHLD